MQDYKQYYFKQSGSTVGFLYSLGLEHKLNDNWGVGANFSFSQGVVTVIEFDNNGSKVTTTINDINDGVGLGQWVIKAGVRYFINPPKKKI